MESNHFPFFDFPVESANQETAEFLVHSLSWGASMKQCRRWFRGEEGASDGLQPGDEVTIPVHYGFPRADRDRVEVVVAVNDEGAAMTSQGTLIPCMYNPIFEKTGRHFDTVVIPEAVRLRLRAGGWKIEP